MANHTKTITLTDDDQKLFSDSIYNDTDNKGIDAWIQDAVDGKVNNCWKRFQSEWTTKLLDDTSVLAISASKSDFVEQVTNRSDYQNRTERDSS